MLKKNKLLVPFEAQFMQKTLSLARKAIRAREVPIGAVLVRHGKVISSAYNLTKTLKSPLAHAEIITIERALKKIKNERFLDTELYVSLEPCPMCAGAIVQARIPRVFFGAWDPKAGACGSVVKILPHKKLNHRPTVKGGIYAEESAQILRDFFRRRRKSKIPLDL